MSVARLKVLFANLLDAYPPSIVNPPATEHKGRTSLNRENNSS